MTSLSTQLALTLNKSNYTISDLHVFLEKNLIDINPTYSLSYAEFDKKQPNTNKILEFINKQRQTNKDKYDLDDLKFIARKCCISIYYEPIEFLETVVLKFIRNEEIKNNWYRSIEDIKKELSEYDYPILSDDLKILGLQLRALKERDVFINHALEYGQYSQGGSIWGSPQYGYMCRHFNLNYISGKFCNIFKRKWKNWTL